MVVHHDAAREARREDTNVMISTTRLSEAFVEVADTLVDDFDVVDFLSTLTGHAKAVSGAAAAGLLLADHNGRLQFMAATDQDSRSLELYQLQNAEGPCLEAFRLREPVVNADLAHAGERWPLFAPRAIEAGYRSVHAFPMRLRDRGIGALNLFGSDDQRFDPDEVLVVQALADIATIGLLQQRSIADAEGLTEQLQAALNTRIVIEQAKGAYALLNDISVDEAFRRLRKQARSSNRRLAEVCADVLDRS
jgi:GAF domain-containing protein